MYKQNKMAISQMTNSEITEGERLECKIERITSNKEPIKDGAQEIFTERKDGVGAAYNIRTDRWDIAADAMDYVGKSHIANREERQKIREEETAIKESGKDGEAVPAQGKTE